MISMFDYLCEQRACLLQCFERCFYTYTLFCIFCDFTKQITPSIVYIDARSMNSHVTKNGANHFANKSKAYGIDASTWMILKSLPGTESFDSILSPCTQVQDRHCVGSHSDHLAWLHGGACTSDNLPGLPGKSLVLPGAERITYLAVIWTIWRSWTRQHG